MTGIVADSGNEADLMSRMGFSPAEVDAAKHSRVQFKTQLSTVPSIPKADRDTAVARARQMEADRLRDEASRERGRLIAVPMSGPLGNPTDEEATVNARGQQRPISDSEKLERQNEARSLQFEQSFKSPDEKRQEAAEKAAVAQAAQKDWCTAHPVECAQKKAKQEQEDDEAEQDRQAAQNIKSDLQRDLFMGHSPAQLKTDLFMAGAGHNGPETQHVVSEMERNLFMGHSAEQLKTDVFMLHP
jgi:hypothetical protein